MLFPISDALAAGEAASAGGMESFLVQVVPLIVIFVVFWFFLIRPQQKRQKEHAKMCDALAKGDEVMTMGGISGRIESVDEQSRLCRSLPWTASPSLSACSALRCRWFCRRARLSSN